MATLQRQAGAWSLAPGQATLLRPARCGHVTARSAGLRANGGPLPIDEPVRVWSGEKVQLRNADGHGPAYFAWDFCRVQPGARSRWKHGALAILTACASAFLPRSHRESP